MTTSAASQIRGRRPADLKVLEQRRRQAARLFARRVSQAEIARQLGVSAQTASRWHARWARGGTRGLRASPRAASSPSSAR